MFAIITVKTPPKKLLASLSLIIASLCKRNGKFGFSKYVLSEEIVVSSINAKSFMFFTLIFNSTDCVLN